MWTYTIYIWTISFLFYLQPPNVSSFTTTNPRRTSVGPTVKINLHGVSVDILDDYDGGYTGYAWVGGLSVGKNLRIEDCRQRCNGRSNPKCQSFDFNTEFKECFLHLEGEVDSCTNAQRQPCPECIHYRVKNRYCGDVRTLFEEGVQRRTFNGKLKPGMLTRDECLLFCNKDPSCMMVDYNSDDNSCWWHTQCTDFSPCTTSCSVNQYRKIAVGCGAAIPSVPTSAVITGTVSTTLDPRAGEIYDDVRVSTSYGGGIQAGNFDQLVLCQNQCFLDPNCQGVDYNTNDQSCWKHTSSTVCGTPRTSCTSCTHYKNKRAQCYNPSGTQPPTTQDPSVGTTQQPIFNKFQPQMNNRDLMVVGDFEFSNSLAHCLQKCDSDSACHAASYGASSCYHYNVNEACGIQQTRNGWVLYFHVRKTCGNAIYNDFHGPQNNRRRPVATVRSGINNREICLTQCKANSNCRGVNYDLLNHICEHVISTIYQCSNFLTAANYVHYTLKIVDCNPGVSTTTTTLAPVSAVSQCWERMVKRNPMCTKPSRTNLDTRIQDMEEYCRTYNKYFECTLNNHRQTDCPSISRTQLANHVNGVADLKVDNIRFCQIFSQGLQTCLDTNPVKVDNTRCQNKVKPGTNIRGTLNPAQCNPFRDYLECVGSVVQYSCREFSAEYYDKSTKNILRTSYSNCAAMSQPKISGVNTIFGPAKGSSQLAIRGREINLPNSTPMLLFNDSFDPCQGNSITRNTTHYICNTKGRTANQFYFSRLRYESGTYKDVYFMVGNFTYKTDPLVNGIMPAKTVVGGGTLVTVAGTYLSYVVTSTFRVTRGDGVVFSSPCRHNEEDTAIPELLTLVCEVPAITLPGARSVSSGQPVTNVIFRTGLLLDGVNLYQDLEQAGVVNGIRLDVYGPPDIAENPEKSFELKKFWPVSQTKLEIPGQHLDTAASSRDYTVLIGSQPCTNLEISSTVITCEPPVDNPFTNDTQPPIIVQAPGPDGFQTGIHVGTLDYQESIFDNSAGKYGLIGAAVGVVVIFIILIVICCCCCDGCPCNRDKYYDEESLSDRS